MKNAKRKALGCLLFLVLVAIFLSVYVSTNEVIDSTEMQPLDEGWEVQFNDDNYKNITLSSMEIPVANKGDELIMKHKIPTLYNTNATLRFYAVFSVFEVSLDGQIIYKYGHEDNAEGHIVGFGYHFIPLPADCEGKLLQIHMCVTECNAFSSLHTPYICDESTAWINFISRLRAPFAINVSLIMFGLCLTTITLFLYFRNYSMEKLLCVGFFSLIVGCWSLCNYDLIEVFTTDLRVKTYMEFIALLMAPMPILFYFREEVEKQRYRWMKIFYYVLIITQVVLWIVNAVGMITDLAHFPEFLQIEHAYIIICAVYFLILAVEDIRKKDVHLVLAVGFSIMIITAIRDIIFFNLAKYYTFLNENNFRSYVSVGALSFVLSLVIDFVYRVRKKLYKNAETEFLEKIAYTDYLTGLHTRRKCEEIFHKLDSNKKIFCIIHFDLNNLKSTNDYLGHEKGDLLLKRFAQALRECYQDDESIGRMGGDEFIVIIPDLGNRDIQNSIDRLMTIIGRMNQEKDVVPISVAYGFCISDEDDVKTAKDVYITADRRMYDNKAEYYGNHPGRRRNDN